MRKFALALLALALLASPAHAQKTKANMTTEINTNLPDNTTGLITPAILRSTLIDMVNSWYGLVDTTNVGTGASTFAQINQSGATSGLITLQTQAAAGTWNWNWPITAGVANQVLTSQGGGGAPMTWQTANLLNGGTFNASAGSPGSTTSSTGVMMGLGTGCKLTPTASTRIYVAFFGGVSNNTASAQASVTIRFGTGTAPANGAALTGTISGSTTFVINNANAAGTAGAFFPLTNMTVITGLTPGTAYWFDVGVAASSGGGTVQLNNFVCQGFEM
ncbi:MAG TPA: hypothetical protein VF748_14785 [Candidatus Acidoferrum sp.]